ncbi:MAG: adenine phosphoribosyltransferase [Verrucomicrobiales bacterium]|jgi:adenine phosphoribosyltransferase
MNDTDRQRLNAAIRDVPDFPKPGIVFKDITPVLGDGELFRLAVDGLIETAGDKEIDKIVGIDARGFIFGAAAAHKLGIGFVPVRKKGKLPWQTEACAYSLEYGEAEIEVHKDAVHAGERVLLIDDLLATGGTAAAAVELLGRLGCDLIGLAFLIELKFLNGREQLGNAPVSALLEY